LRLIKVFQSPEHPPKPRGRGKGEYTDKRMDEIDFPTVNGRKEKGNEDE